MIAKTRAIELFTLAVLLVTLSAAYITNVMGLSFALGAFLAGMIIFVLDKDRKPLFSGLSKKDLFSIGILSLTILGSLASTFWAYSAAPLIAIQPIFLISEMIIPSLLGLYYFKEIKALDTKEKVIFAVGIAGGLLVNLSFRH